MHRRGFTLVELLVVIAYAAPAPSIGASFSAFL
jgi:Tfp pilus assembly protein FimT